MATSGRRTPRSDRYREKPGAVGRSTCSRWTDVVQDITGRARSPPVTWITPRFELSEHPEYSFCHGENWSTRVINAIMRSPMWKDTAIFLTWDDYGGFYDHVPPPQVDGFGFGFRVPTIVLSPYARQGASATSSGSSPASCGSSRTTGACGSSPERDRAGDADAVRLRLLPAPRPRLPLPEREDCTGPQFPED